MLSPYACDRCGRRHERPQGTRWERNPGEPARRVCRSGLLCICRVLTDAAKRPPKQPIGY